MHSPVEGTTVGSNPSCPANYGPVAQSVERRSYKADVVRAIRTGTTNMRCYTAMQADPAVTRASRS
jgi:hypothetical protein